MEGSCLFQVTAANVNSHSEFQSSLTQLAEFMRTHPRGIVLLDEFNLWTDTSVVNDLLIPIARHPGSRLVLAGANLPENKVLSAIITADPERSSEYYVNYPAADMWSQHQSNSDAIKKSTSQSQLNALCDPNQMKKEDLHKLQLDLPDELEQNDFSVKLAKRKLSKCTTDDQDDDSKPWCQVTPAQLEMVQRELKVLNKVIDGMPDQVIVMLPISMQCARHAVKEKLLEHVQWLQSERVAGGPIYHSVKLSASVADAVAKQVFPDLLNGRDTYLSINDPKDDPLEQEQVSKCWAVKEGKKKRKTSKGKKKRKIYSNLLVKGLRRLGDDAATSLRAVLEKTSVRQVTAAAAMVRDRDTALTAGTQSPAA